MINRQETASERIRSVDIAKGISIFLVVFGHSHLVLYLGDVNKGLGLFRLPFFFFLSGVFFRPAADFKNLFFNKTDALLKPYFVTMAGVLIARYLMYDLPLENLTWSMKGVLYGVGDCLLWPPLWFLPHLWLIFVFSWVLLKFSGFADQTISMKVVIVLLTLVTGLYLMEVAKQLALSKAFLGENTTVQGWPFSLDLVAISSVYFIMGHLLRDKVINFKPTLRVFILATVVFLTVALASNARIDFNSRLYVNPALALIASGLGIYIGLSLAHYVSSQRLLSKVLVYMGYMSLFLLLFHNAAEIYAFMTLYKIQPTGSILVMSVVALTFALAAPLFIGFIVRKTHVLGVFFLSGKARNARDVWWR